jgi:hypothetical protein
VPTRLLGDTKTFDHCFLVFVLRPVLFFLLAARMLSTRLGRLRPAFFGRALGCCAASGRKLLRFLARFFSRIRLFPGWLSSHRSFLVFVQREPARTRKSNIKFAVPAHSAPGAVGQHPKSGAYIGSSAYLLLIGVRSGR